MTHTSSPDATEIKPDEVDELARALTAAADATGAAAGGAPRNGAVIPYDWFDLPARVIALDEAREAFDHRLAMFLRHQAAAAAEQATRVRAADR